MRHMPKTSEMSHAQKLAKDVDLRHMQLETHTSRAWATFRRPAYAYTGAISVKHTEE